MELGVERGESIEATAERAGHGSDADDDVDVDVVHGEIRSKDGTAIAFERSGAGPALVIVDGALCSRAFGPSRAFAKLLARRFTVITYDRRGRGESGDTAPYAPAREVEDLEALIREAGGTAHVLGFSSGGALALEAAATTPGLRKLAVYEPPFMVDDGRDHAIHEGELARRIAAGRRGDAVRYFMRDMVGIPAPFVLLMRLAPMWRRLEAVAPTLPYDAAIMGDSSLPVARLAAVRVPTLVGHGEKTDARLRKAAHAVAAAVPGAELRSLPGQRHDVKPEALSPALFEFFGA